MMKEAFIYPSLLTPLDQTRTKSDFFEEFGGVHGKNTTLYPISTRQGNSTVRGEHEKSKSNVECPNNYWAIVHNRELGVPFKESTSS